MLEKDTWIDAPAKKIERLKGILILPNIGPPENRNRKYIYKVRYGLVVATYDFEDIVDNIDLHTGSVWGTYHTRDVVDSISYDFSIKIPGNSFPDILRNITIIESQFGFGSHNTLNTREWKSFKFVFNKQPILKRIWANMWIVGG